MEEPAAARLRHAYVPNSVRAFDDGLFLDAASLLRAQPAYLTDARSEGAKMPARTRRAPVRAQRRIGGSFAPAAVHR